MPCIGLILFVLFSCKKENTNPEVPQNPGYEYLLPKIKTWLDEQKSNLSEKSVATIESLKSNLSHGEIRLEKYKDSKEFIVIPVLKGFESGNNAGKDPANYLVLVFEDQDRITKGNIIQYTSSNNQKTIPVNTFSKIFTYKNLECSGQFTMLSISDYFQYDLKFEGGKLKSVAESRSKAGSRSGRTNDTCTDWYLVTTYYYSDGSSYTTEVYMFTTCDCHETRMANGRNFQIECRSGGGGNGIGYEYAVSRAWKWDIGTTANWWAVSYESVNGVRNNNEPQGGHFTGITHTSSYFEVAVPGYTWQEVGNTPSLDNPQRVYSTTTGKAFNPNQTFSTVSNWKFASFIELFP